MKHALIALLLASPAAATACVTANDLATGVIFTREDGRSGFAITEGRDIRIVYSAMNDDWTDTRLSRMGVYDRWAEFHFDPLPTVGGGYPQYEWTYARRLPTPTPGKSFKTRVTQTRSEDIGTRVTPPPVSTKYEATYTFLEARQATLSDCPYTVVPVEAAYSDGTTQRYLYFPDLGFGLETRTRGLERPDAERRGLIELIVKP
jgi:hypothetical protein